MYIAKSIVGRREKNINSEIISVLVNNRDGRVFKTEIFSQCICASAVSGKHGIVSKCTSDISNLEVKNKVKWSIVQKTITCTNIRDLLRKGLPGTSWHRMNLVLANSRIGNYKSS